MDRFVQPMKGTLGPPEAGPPLKDVQAELERVLAPKIQRGKLTRVRLWESPDLYVDCYGDGAGS